MSGRYLLHVALLAMAGAGPLVAVHEARAAETQTQATCSARRLEANGVTLSGCRFSVPGAGAEQTARQFIALHRGERKMPDVVTDLVHIGTRRGLASRYVRFQQFLFGYPVHGGFVTVHVDDDGAVRRLHSNADSRPLAAMPGTGALSAEAAQEIARQVVASAAGALPNGLVVRGSRQVWFPGSDGTLALAWEIVVTADRPLLDVAVFVDVARGTVLHRQDRLVQWTVGSGSVFRPNPIQSSGDMTITQTSPSSYIDSLRVTAVLPGLDEGTGVLRGRYADVSQPSPFPPCTDPDCVPVPPADEADRHYVYETADPKFTQVNAYYAIDSAQRYVRALGFSDDRTFPNGFLGYPFVAYPAWNEIDNSFYRPTTQTLHFGYGGVPDAEDGDIVAHEYGHAIQHAQNPLWGCSLGDSCEMRAMGEGFSDYFAAVVHAGFGHPAYQAVDAACVGEWDSTAYAVTPPLPPCLRRVDRDKRYPDDLVGQIHRDGEIWSRALWDLRNAIGGNVATQIVLEHHFLLPQDATMPQAARGMLDVDAELFGGAHEGALRAAFCARNVLQGGECVLPNRTIQFVAASKDTTLTERSPHGNEGASPILRIAGRNDDSTKTRVVLAFDLSGIDLGQVRSAVLELVVANSDPQWGIHGRTIDVHPLAVDFDEGNSVNIGADASQKLPGSGSGATWFCGADAEIGNATLECPSLPWRGGRYPETVQLGAGRENIPSVVLTNGMTGRVRWNVTSDVKAVPPVSRWIVKKTFGDTSGMVNFHSREGALAIDPADQAGLRPRLVLTLQ